MIVTIRKVKTEPFKLLKRVDAGAEIIIARGDKPIAMLKGLSLEQSAAIRMTMLKTEMGI